MQKETRNERFKRMAIQRTNKLLEQLRILGNLANKSYYNYTDAEVNKMFRVIEEQLRIVKGKFKQEKRKFEFS